MNYDDNNPPTEACEEDIATRAAREFAINLETAIEMVAWVANELGAVGGVEAAEKLNQKFRSAMRELVAYQSNQGSPNELRMSTRVMALALGYVSAAGARDIVTLAREMGFKKQTPNHCLNHFVKKLDLPPSTGQRSNESKELMRQSRRKQLKH